MSVRRRTVLAAAAAALAVTAASPGLIAATSPPDSGGEPVTISFLTHWPPETVALLEEAGAAYSEEHPNVTVEIQAVPFGDLLTTIRAQAGGDAPTISGIYDLWLPELVRDEIVAPAPEDVAAAVSENWPAGVATAATVDDAVYGVPNEIDLYALNYNTRMFEEAGIEAPPATWDELLAAAEALTVRDGDTITRQGFGPDQLVGGRCRSPVRLAARLQRRIADRRGRDAGTEHARRRWRRSSSTRTSCRVCRSPIRRWAPPMPTRRAPSSTTSWPATRR